MTPRNRIRHFSNSLFNSFITNFLAKPKNVLVLCINWKKYCIHKSYFPEKKHKSTFNVFCDQLAQVVKFGAPNEYYFSYGFDVKNRHEIGEYYHYRPFMLHRDKYNLHPHSSSAILRNKLYFDMFTEALGIVSSHNIGILKDGKIFDLITKQTSNIQTFFASRNGNYFIKLTNGECGCGILTLRISDQEVSINDKSSNLNQLSNLTERGEYLIQPKVEQHKKMASLHDYSLNTIRLVTIKNVRTGKISILPSILRIGTGKSVVDNTSQGGIAVGIDIDTGKLKKYGFLKPQYGTRVESHPDSNILFSEFSIPYWEEVKAQAIMLHSMLPDLGSIGWDIAIGLNGPVFIEGNDNWEINGPQICNGGLKHLFNQYLDK